MNKDFEIFKQYFLENEGGFTSSELFSGAFDMIIKFRNPKKHGSKIYDGMHACN